MLEEKQATAMHQISRYLYRAWKGEKACAFRAMTTEYRHCQHERRMQILESQSKEQLLSLAVKLTSAITRQAGEKEALLAIYVWQNHQRRAQRRRRAGQGDPSALWDAVEKKVEKTKKKLDLSSYSDKQLERYMKKLFKIADKDGNGTLDRKELTDMLGWSGFGFVVTSMEDVMAKGDKNGDGVIEFSEFAAQMKAFCRTVGDAVDFDERQEETNAHEALAGRGGQIQPLVVRDRRKERQKVGLRLMRSIITDLMGSKVRNSVRVWQAGTNLAWMHAVDKAHLSLTPILKLRRRLELERTMVHDTALRRLRRVLAIVTSSEKATCLRRWHHRATQARGIATRIKYQGRALRHMAALMSNEGRVKLNCIRCIARWIKQVEVTHNRDLGSEIEQLVKEAARSRCAVTYFILFETMDVCV